MPIIISQIANIAADILVFVFAGYFLLIYIRKQGQLEQKEKDLLQKEGKIDTEFHQVVENALTKERKILEDASTEANAIISKTEYVTQSTRDVVNKALQQITTEIQTEAKAITGKFIADYQSAIKQIADQSLTDFRNVTTEMATTSKTLQETAQNTIKQAATQSLTNFQTITKELETNLQKEIKDFRETLLATIEKEAETYKQERLKQIEQLINHIIQKVSQEALHKTIPLEDHKNLIINALDKAKKEGVFD